MFNSRNGGVGLVSQFRGAKPHRRRSMKLRTTAKLPESIERRLVSYCISAGATESMERRLVSYFISAAATGFGALALSQPADARIVYTPVHVSMFPPGPPGSHTNYYCIDFDHKGVADVCLSRGAELYNTWLGAYPNSPSGDAVAISAGRRFAVAVRAGAKIGASRHFLANEFRVDLADGAHLENSHSKVVRTVGKWRQGP